MQAGVEEREEPKHAPKLNEPILPRQFAHRGDGECHHQEHERPCARGPGDDLNRVGAESGIECLPAQPFQGNKAGEQTIGLRYFGFKGSEILLEIHSSVEGRDLISIAVEHQSRPLEEFAYAAFFGLAPARMIDIGVHIGVETILVRRGFRPG